MSSTRVFLGTAFLLLIISSTALVIAIVEYENVPSHQSDSMAFVPSTQDCAITSTSLEMLGFGSTLKYTPSLTGDTLLTVNFQIWHPAGDHDLNYTLMYGTGAAPTCGAAATGTAIGNTYSTSSLKQAGTGFDSFAAVSDTVALTLVPGSHYWFDVRVHVEMAVTHHLFNPQMSVIEAS